MKRIKQKNQIIVTLLALMIAVSGYLHFANKGAADIEDAINAQANAPGVDDIETTMGQITAEDIENSSKNDEPSDNKEEGKTDGNAQEEAKEEKKEETKKEDSDDESAKQTDGGKVEDSSLIGQAVLVNTTINADFFYAAKLNREQLRAKNTQTLMEIVNNKNMSEEQKNKATEEIINITKRAETENAIESLLAAKGFENCVVSMDEESVDVVVDISAISLEQAAVIEDVVMRKTGFASENIVITPANGE